jgi:hypothetical protein
MLQLTLPCAQAVLRNAHPRLKLAHPYLMLKQWQLGSKEGNGKHHENVSVCVDLYQHIKHIHVQIGELHIVYSVYKFQLICKLYTSSIE